MTTLPKMEPFCIVGVILLKASAVNGTTRVGSCSDLSVIFKVDCRTSPPSKETAGTSFSEMTSMLRAFVASVNAARATLEGPATRAALVARIATLPNMMSSFELWRITERKSVIVQRKCVCGSQRLVKSALNLGAKCKRSRKSIVCEELCRVVNL
jgi:hypothetical protein